MLIEFFEEQIRTLGIPNDDGFYDPESIRLGWAKGCADSLHQNDLPPAFNT
jgi:hypothetical protein